MAEAKYRAAHHAERLAQSRNYHAVAIEYEGTLRGMPTVTLGRFAESIVRADLKARGFTILPATSSKYDILAEDRAGRRYRVEVRTAAFNKRTGQLYLRHRPEDRGRSDCYVSICFHKHLLTYTGTLGDVLGYRITNVNGEDWWSVFENVPRRRSLRITSFQHIFPEPDVAA